MKTSFLPRLVNGQTGDPALFVDLLREKRALLFDCGTLTSLSASEVMRVSDVFISHTHIDHFIGFDHLLRLQLGRGKKVRLYGPRGITACVRGKLAGYTWNLVRRQRLVFEVREFDGHRSALTQFPCRERFRQGETRLLPPSEVIWQDELVTVRSAVLDHRTASLAFSVAERNFINVNPVRLVSCGLRPGPWLNELKRWARRGRDPELEIALEGKPRRAAELAELLIETRGRKLAYVADALGCDENSEKIRHLARDADVLFCEGAFLHADLARAEETYHLTARQAGELARQAGARRLVLFHFSPKYDGRFAELEDEAGTAFGSTVENSATRPG